MSASLEQARCRPVSYGMNYPTDFDDTHLGRVGRTAWRYGMPTPPKTSDEAILTPARWRSRHGVTIRRARAAERQSETHECDSHAAREVCRGHHRQRRAHAVLRRAFNRRRDRPSDREQIPLHWCGPRITGAVAPDAVARRAAARERLGLDGAQQPFVHVARQIAAGECRPDHDGRVARRVAARLDGCRDRHGAA